VKPRGRWALGAIGVVSTIGLPLPTGPASATSCVVHPDTTPESIVSGREMLLHDEPFFEQFDLAITATVAAITTDERSGSSTYGATEIAVDGINAFGVDNVPGSLIVTASDPVGSPAIHSRSVARTSSR
jgi:hypothetical protein